MPYIEKWSLALGGYVLYIVNYHINHDIKVFKPVLTDYLLCHTFYSADEIT